MSNVYRLPIIPRPRPVEEDEPITALRKAIQRCVQVRGIKTTALVIAQAFEIPNTHDWRSRARHFFSGDKS